MGAQLKHKHFKRALLFFNCMHNLSYKNNYCTKDSHSFGSFQFYTQKSLCWRCFPPVAFTQRKVIKHMTSDFDICEIDVGMPMSCLNAAMRLELNSPSSTPSLSQCWGKWQKAVFHLNGLLHVEVTSVLLLNSHILKALLLLIQPAVDAVVLLLDYQRYLMAVLLLNYLRRFMSISCWISIGICCQFCLWIVIFDGSFVVGSLWVFDVSFVVDFDTSFVVGSLWTLDVNFVVESLWTFNASSVIESQETFDTNFAVGPL